MDDVTIFRATDELADELTLADREFLRWVAHFVGNLRLLPAEDALFFMEPAIDEIRRIHDRLSVSAAHPESGRRLREELADLLRSVTAVAAAHGGAGAADDPAQAFGQASRRMRRPGDVPGLASYWSMSLRADGAAAAHSSPSKSTVDR